MPCSDSTSRIEVRIDSEERLTGYRYRKITCGKEIGGEGSLESVLRGRSAEAILSLSFDEALAAAAPANEEDGFFAFLEWNALHAALALYRGGDPGGDEGRYAVASIEHDPEGTIVRLDVRPPAEMPPIRSCASATAEECVPRPLPVKEGAPPCRKLRS